MLSPDETTQTTEALEQVSRPLHRRDSVYERRQSILQQKQTDALPRISNETLNARIAWRQLIQLREENKRLRWELAEANRGTISGETQQEQEIEHYRGQVQRVRDDHNHLKDTHSQLEQRYQELYHTFQYAVEEEAQKMVEDAARTIELTPEDQPVMLNNMMKTVELRVRQFEDKHTAEALYLMRQAQRKAAQLEQELVQERQHIAIERQNIQNIQKSAREQAELRKRIVEDRLRGQYTLNLTLVTTLLLLLLPIFQVTVLSLSHIHISQPLFFALFIPLFVCLLFAAVFYAHSSKRITSSSMPGKQAEKKK